MAKRQANQIEPPNQAEDAPKEVMARQLRIGFLLHDVSRLRRKFYDQEMRRYGITNIREFFKNDVRFLRQF